MYIQKALKKLRGRSLGFLCPHPRPVHVPFGGSFFFKSCAASCPHAAEGLRLPTTFTQRKEGETRPRAVPIGKPFSATYRPHKPLLPLSRKWDPGKWPRAAGVHKLTAASPGYVAGIAARPKSATVSPLWRSLPLTDLRSSRPQWPNASPRLASAPAGRPICSRTAVFRAPSCAEAGAVTGRWAPEGS